MADPRMPSLTSLGREHQVHILHRSPRSTLAEIVEQRHQIDMRATGRTEDEELHRVLADQFFSIHARQLGAVGKRNDADDILPRIMGNQCRVDAFHCRAGGEVFEEERDLHDHALREAADGRGKQRRPVEQAMRLHLRHMLVLERQSVKEIVGGDPLSMSTRRIADLVARLSAIPHLEVIRFHSRMPVVEPEKIDAALLAALETDKALFIAVHANHADEFTPEVETAIRRLTRAGIALVSQSVLLAGVNDSVEALEKLMRAFVRNRIKPYYLHHLDLARGTGHFRVSLQRGQEIVSGLRGRVSGLCQPSFMLDIPGGHGKVPVGPSHLTALGGGAYEIRDPKGVTHLYRDPAEKG